mmetsp:Transcript_2693/g.7627  ORF Transcript_2693/g.7627 Transcript_2693/m.7627 type:complete len:172 (+) Transcript_2693:351-866(+)
MEHLDHCNDGLLDLGLLQWLRASDYRRRSLTAILYLNSPNWGDPLRAEHRDDGGQLRIFHSMATAAGGDGDKAAATDGGKAVLAAKEGEGQRCHTDIVPRGGTLVLFDSRRVRHKVLPSTRLRHALTIWVCGDSNGAQTPQVHKAQTPLCLPRQAVVHGGQQAAMCGHVHT